MLWGHEGFSRIRTRIKRFLSCIDSEQHRLIPKYDIMCSSVSFLNTIMWLWGRMIINPKLPFIVVIIFKIFRYELKLLYNIFIRAGMSTLGIYSEKIVPYHFYFQCPVRNKLQRMYQKLLKKVNGDHKYFCLPDLQYNNCDIMRSEI